MAAGYGADLGSLDQAVNNVQADSDNVQDAYGNYLNSYTNESNATLGTAGTDTLYSDFENNYASMRRQFMEILSDVGNSLDLSARALREIARRYRAADGDAAAHFNAIHQEMRNR